MLTRLIGALLGSATLAGAFFIAPANADPTVDGKVIVCGTFDQYGVNEKSVKWIGDYLINRANQTPRSAVTMIQVSIAMYCPNYQQPYNDLARQLERNRYPDNPLFN